MIAAKKFSPRILACLLSKQYPHLIDARITNIEQQYLVSLSEELGVSESDLTKDRASISTHMQYKYQIVLDGTTAVCPGYAWRLLSDCCVFKVDSILYHWYHTGLIPWVHYIPVKTDLSDLIEKVLWAMENDSKAQEIALNGRKFALDNLEVLDWYKHAQYVIQKYASYQSLADSKYR